LSYTRAMRLKPYTHPLDLSQSTHQVRQ